MKFINCAEALPGRVAHRFEVSEYSYIRNAITKGMVEPGYFRSYAGLNEDWALSKFEWLDEASKTFTIEDMKAAFLAGANWGDGTSKEKPIDWFNRIYDIDISK